jgi:hypothetical protein
MVFFRFVRAEKLAQPTAPAQARSRVTPTKLMRPGDMRQDKSNGGDAPSVSLTS